MEVMKNLSRHIRRWNRWRKRNTNGHLHHILVLLGVVKSPTFAFTLLPEEIYILDEQLAKNTRSIMERSDKHV